VRSVHSDQPDLGATRSCSRATAAVVVLVAVVGDALVAAGASAVPVPAGVLAAPVAAAPAVIVEPAPDRIHVVVAGVAGAAGVGLVPSAAVSLAVAAVPVVPSSADVCTAAVEVTAALVDVAAAFPAAPHVVSDRLVRMLLDDAHR
jgi:hypothetical protein